MATQSALTAEFFPATADIQLPPGIAGPEPLSFDVRAFAVRRGNDVILVDTLPGPEHAGLLQDALAAADSEFADLRYVVLTHHHPDHTGGLAEVARRAPQAQILCGAADLTAITRATGVRGVAVDAADAVIGLDVIPTPGHTAGHICLFDAASSTMLLGDVAGNAGGLVRAPTAFTEDPVQYEVTLRSLAERQFDRALPSHGPAILGRAAAQLLQLADQAP